MMNKKRTNSSAKVKYLLLLPLTVALVFLGNNSAEASNLAKKTAMVSDNKSTLNIKIVDGPTESDNMSQDEKKYKTADGEEVLTVCDELPIFPGGMQKLFQYLGENIQYPEEAQKNEIEETIILAFFILKDGSVSEIKVLKGENELLKKEAIRVVEAMPKWTPGKQKGEPVNVRYVLPVSFKLNKPK